MVVTEHWSVMTDLEKIKLLVVIVGDDERREDQAHGGQHVGDKAGSGQVVEWDGNTILIKQGKTTHASMIVSRGWWPTIHVIDGDLWSMIVVIRPMKNLDAKSGLKMSSSSIYCTNSQLAPFSCDKSSGLSLWRVPGGAWWKASSTWPLTSTWWTRTPSRWCPAESWIDSTVDVWMIYIWFEDG